MAQISAIVTIIANDLEEYNQTVQNVLSNPNLLDPTFDEVHLTITVRYTA